MLTDLVPSEDELPDEHQYTIASTWSLSIKRANGIAPKGVARPLLEIASALDPAGIPAGLFMTDAVINYLSGHVDRTLDARDIQAGLGILHRFNLITLDSAVSHCGVTIHGLVQRATRDTLAVADVKPFADHDGDRNDRLSDLAYAVADAMLEIWPEVESDGDLALALRTNTANLIHHAGQHLWDPKGHAVQFRLGRSIGESGLVTHAVNYFHHLRASATRHLGPATLTPSEPATTSLYGGAIRAMLPAPQPTLSNYSPRPCRYSVPTIPTL
jgi:hypothetical protein